MADSLYWIWLAESMGAGSYAYGPLLERFGSPYEIYRADEEELYRIPDTSERELAGLFDKNLERAQRIVDYCTRNGVGILTYDNERFPERLKKLRNSPIVLYYKGTLPDIDRRLCVAVIGTRKSTEYGDQTAYKMGYELAYAGAVVVGGMALGVDGIAACGAIEAGGTTIAVLGSGIDVVYPREHKTLMNNIIKRGAVITEYAPGSPPSRHHFPTRNRIISGLCVGTLVVEADAISGALITANEALYQGRDVYALPGNIDAINSAGTNKLLKEGAKIVTGVDDIIDDHEFLYSDSISYERLKRAKDRSFYNPEAIARMGVESRGSVLKKKQIAKPEEPPKKEPTEKVEKKKIFGKTLKKKKEVDISLLDDIERKVYGMIPDGPVSADMLASRGIAASEAMSTLTMLEIKGVVESLPGGFYVKK